MSQRAYEISLRQQYTGGAIADIPLELPQIPFQTARRLILLIHGFNATLCEAGCSFTEFRSTLPKDLDPHAASLYWPGDAMPLMGNPPPSQRRNKVTNLYCGFSYPFQIGVAREAARKLFSRVCDALKARPVGQPSLVIEIVAHSLGSRLALEFLKLCAAADHTLPFRVGVVALMAAAVPRYMVIKGGSLHEGARLPRDLLVYYSGTDSILGALFRFGQIAEGDILTRLKPSTRTAVGKAGSWLGLANLRPTQRDDLDHGGYWPDSEVSRGISMALQRERDPAGIYRAGPVDREVSNIGRTYNRNLDSLPRTNEERRISPRMQAGLCISCRPCETAR